MYQIPLTAQKRRIAAVYDLAAPGYDHDAVRFFRLAAEWLVEFAGVRQGQRILDVATGTGAAAIPASRVAGPNGRVVGVDIAPAMLEQARVNARRAGCTNLLLRAADAENLPFTDAAFDIVLSAAGLFFLPNMCAVLEHWRSVVRPGGTVAFSAFGDTAFQPLSDIFATRLRGYGVHLSPGPRPFSWQRLAGPTDCINLLCKAGFEDVQAKSRQRGYYLPDAEAWWEIVWNSGFRGPVSELTSAELDQFRAEHLADIASLATREGIYLDVPVICARGRRADP